MPALSPVGKDLTLRGYQLFEITKDPARLKQGERFVPDRLQKGTLKPASATTFMLDDIVEAYRFMETNDQVGKSS